VGGGGVGETIGEMNGIPVSKNALVTTSKGVTRSVVDRKDALQDAETEALMGDDDI
jgi:hypothetical protein